MSAFEDDIHHCLSVLESGGTILYPTDTIWGIGCDATNESAVQKLYRIKERSVEKSMLILLADERDLLKYVASPDPAVFDFLKTTSRPTTIIYQNAIGFAPGLVRDDGSIGIRIVQEKFCRHLIKRFRKPIVSTSANYSGDPTPKKFSEIFNDIRTSVDYVVHYRRDETQEGQSSAILKWNSDGSQTVIRD